MRKPTSGPDEPIRGSSTEALEWQVHLARREPWRAVVATGFILAAGVTALLVFHSALSALLASGLLLAATGEFLLPVSYRLTPEGAEARNLFTWRQIRWQDVKRIYLGAGEIKLSPLAHGGTREAFRGVLLRCGENQAAIQTAVEEYRRVAAGS